MAHGLKVAGYIDVMPARGRLQVVPFWPVGGIGPPPLLAMRATFLETLPYASVAGGSPVKSLVSFVSLAVRAALLPMSDGCLLGKGGEA